MSFNVGNRLLNPLLVLLIGSQSRRAEESTGTDEKGQEAEGVGSRTVHVLYKYINSWTGGGFSAPCSLHRLVGR